MTSLPALAALSSESLTARLDQLAADERCALVDFLHHLAELDRRKLYLGLGYPSLYEYCRDHLRLSDGSAFRRYTAARLLSRFPAIATHLAAGTLSLKRLTLLRNVLTDENHVELLQRATTGTELEVQALAASFAPKPDAKDSIRRAPIAQPHIALTSLPLPPPQPPPTAAQEVPLTRPSLTPILAAPATTPRMEIVATNAERFTMKMSVGPEFIAKFDELKNALSHVVPDGNFELVLLEAFDLALEACAKRKVGSAKAAAKSDPDATASGEGPNTRYIPVTVRREVAARDGNRCAFVGTNARRCTSTHQLEFHHKVAFALGGPATVENLSQRCRMHNQYEAIRDFGEAHMEAMRGKTRASSLPPVEVNHSNQVVLTLPGSAGEPRFDH